MVGKHSTGPSMPIGNNSDASSSGNGGGGGNASSSDATGSNVDASRSASNAGATNAAGCYTLHHALVYQGHEPCLDRSPSAGTDL